MSAEIFVAVVIQAGDKVLLGRVGNGAWRLPEGVLQSAHSIESCAAQALTATTGLTASETPRVFVVTDRVGSSHATSCVQYGAIVRRFTGKIAPAALGDLTELRWAATAGLPDKIDPSSKRVIDAASQLTPRPGRAKRATPLNDDRVLTIVSPAHYQLRVDYGHNMRPHPQATSTTKPLSRGDYLRAAFDLHLARTLGALELTFQLPGELQHASMRDEVAGRAFMDFVRDVGERLGVQAVWENSPRTDEITGGLIEQTSYIPEGFPLCFDIGHWILGAQDRLEALHRIDSFLGAYGAQVAHLHLHINDLSRDEHINDPAAVVKFLGLDRFEKLTHNRTYIFEQGMLEQGTPNNPGVSANQAA